MRREILFLREAPSSKVVKTKTSDTNSSQYNVQFLQVTQVLKRKPDVLKTRRNKTAGVSTKSMSRGISSAIDKGECRYRRKIFSLPDLKVKHIHRHNKPLKPIQGASTNTDDGIRRTSGINLFANALKANIKPDPTSHEKQNAGVTSTAKNSVDFSSVNRKSCAQFSSAQVLQTRIVARRRHTLKPSVANTLNLVANNVTSDTATIGIQNQEASVATAIEHDTFDADLSACSLDTALEIECRTSQQDTDREVSSNQVHASSALINDSLDPVLTVCNLPALLITSNGNQVSNKTCGTTPYNCGMPNMPIQATQQHETQEQKTEMVPCRPIYLEHVDSANQDEVVPPTVRTNGMGIAIDAGLRNIQHENQSKEASVVATLPRPNMENVLTVCDLPTLLISSGVDKISNSQCSRQGYTQIMPCLQAQGPQSEPHNLNIEVLPHEVQYLQPTIDAIKTVNTTNMNQATDTRCIMSQDEHGMPHLEFQVITCEPEELKADLPPHHTYLNSAMSIPHTTNPSTNRLVGTDSGITVLQTENSNTETNMTSEVSSSHIQYLVPNIPVAHSLNTDNLLGNTDCSTPQFSPNMPYLAVHEQQSKQRDKQSLKPNIDIAYTCNTDSSEMTKRTESDRSNLQTQEAKRETQDLKSDRSPRYKHHKSELKADTERCTSEFNRKKCQKTQVAKRHSHDRKSDLSPSRKHQKPDDNGAHKLNTINSDVKRSTEREKRYSSDRNSDQSSTRKYQKADVSGIYNLTTIKSDVKSSTELTSSERNRSKHYQNKQREKRHSDDHKSGMSSSCKYQKSDMKGVHNLISINSDFKNSDYGTSDCNRSKQCQKTQLEKSQTHDLNSDLSPCRKHQKCDVSDFHNMIVIKSDIKSSTEVSTSDCNRSKHDQNIREEKRHSHDRNSDLSPSSKLQKSADAGAHNLTSINSDLKITDRGTSECNRNKQCQKTPEIRQTHDVSSDLSPRCKHQTPDVSDVNNMIIINSDVKSRIEGGTSTQCSLSMPSLEVETPPDTNLDKSCDAKYSKPLAPVFPNENLSKGEAKNSRKRRRTQNLKKKDFPVIAIIPTEVLDSDLSTCSMDTFDSIGANSQNNIRRKETSVSVPEEITSKLPTVTCSVDMDPNGGANCQNNIRREDPPVSVPVETISQPTTVSRSVDVDSNGGANCENNDDPLLSVPVETTSKLPTVSSSDDMDSNAEIIDLTSPINKEDTPDETTDSVPVNNSDMKNISLGCELPNVSTEDTVSDTEDSTPDSNFGFEQTPASPSEEEKPQLTLRSETPQQAPKLETPQRTLKSEPPQQALKSQTPQALKSEMPQQALKSETPQQALRSETPQQALKSETPQQALKSETPQALKSEMPQQALKSETPQQPLKSETPQQALKSETPKQALKSETQQHETSTKPIVSDGMTTDDNTEIVTKADVDSTPISPQPGTSQEMKLASIKTADTSKAVPTPQPSLSANNKESSTKNEASASEENVQPKAAGDLKCNFSRSSRGRRMLTIDGIRYRVNNINGDKVRWRCSTHERFGCKAKVHTLGNKIVYFVDEHITSSPDDNLDDIEPYGIIEEENLKPTND